MARSRTEDLLLYCLRVTDDEAADGRLETLSRSDWDLLIEESGRHGVAPLLYHSLRTCCSAISIPAGVMARLRHLYLRSAGENMHLYHELGKVLGLLRHAQIPVIVLKGAHLAERIYGNRALRSMSDVDLMVLKDDLTRAEVVLLGMGYTPLPYSRDDKHLCYTRRESGLWLEVHWKLLPSVYPFALDTDGQWNRSEFANIAGCEVAVLCPEDLLLHLCLHAWAHGLRPGRGPSVTFVKPSGATRTELTGDAYSFALANGGWANVFMSRSGLRTSCWGSVCPTG